MPQEQQVQLDEETIAHLRKLKDEAEEILGELTDIFPPNYRFTFVARNLDNTAGADIILTNDALEDAIGTLEREAANMEESEQ